MFRMLLSTMQTFVQHLDPKELVKSELIIMILAKKQLFIIFISIFKKSSRLLFFILSDNRWIIWIDGFQGFFSP